MRPMGMTLIFEYSRPKVTLTFDHTHGVDQGFSWSNCCISEWEGRLTLNKGCGSRSFRIKTVTIWWPRSGDRIYHIVTGMTSDISVPSTRLVIIVVVIVIITITAIVGIVVVLTLLFIMAIVLVFLVAYVVACRKQQYWGVWVTFVQSHVYGKQTSSAIMTIAIRYAVTPGEI